MMATGICKSVLNAVLLLGLISVVWSQDYFYSQDFEPQPQQQQFITQSFESPQPQPQPLPQPEQLRRQQRPNQQGGVGREFFFGQSSSSASASAGSNSGNNGNNNVGGFVGVGSINASLQAQFAEIFDWNKDIANDPRFRRCTVPDIGDVERACPKRQFYFGLNPQHRMAVGMVKRILTGPNNAEQTVCLAGAMRDLSGMNPNVWIRGMLGAHLSQESLFDLQVPPMVEVMPHIFINRESLQDARRQSNQTAGSRRCTVVDGSQGRDNGRENALWYFREDVQVNSFHLNWHLIYPFTGITRKADRQGELFYFSHHSHLARYHAERLSNGLGRVIPFNIDVNARVPDAYHPHLDDTNSAMSWTPRRANRPVQDTVFINITGVPPNVSVADRVLHVRRVEDSIRNRGLVLPNGGFFPLDSRTGIDVLGDVVEASIFTPNGEYYGNFGFHNEGHVLLSLIEDPQNRTNLPPGVMLEVATSMRDPVFYTYHTAMDETFDLHKQVLPPYQLDNGELPLRWNGIEITGVEISSDSTANRNNKANNRLTTFLNQRTFELSRGLDFNRSGVQGSVQACVTHLDHNPFTYRIYANRQPQSNSGRATVRIFMAPRFDENGRKYTMLEQRKLFFMLDLFTVLLQPGPNRITRRSTESALTIDIPQSLSQIQSSRPDKIKERPRTYCGCGWPHHLLIPRGTERGLAFDIFVMLTNGDEDYVAPRNSPKRAAGECKPAPIYCGRLNDTYPDSKPMGYPFDRLPYNIPRSWWERPRAVETLEEYTNNLPNAAAIQVTITHTGPNQNVLQQQQQQQRPQNVLFEDEPARQPQFPLSGIVQPSVQTQAQGPVNFGGPVFDTPISPSNTQGANGNGGPVNFDAALQTVPLLHQEHQVYPNQGGGGPGQVQVDEILSPVPDYHDHDHGHHGHSEQNQGSSNYYNYNNNYNNNNLRRGFISNFARPQESSAQVQPGFHQSAFQRFFTNLNFFSNLNNQNYGK